MGGLPRPRSGVAVGTGERAVAARVPRASGAAATAAARPGRKFKLRVLLGQVDAPAPLHSPAAYPYRTPWWGCYSRGWRPASPRRPPCQVGCARWRRGAGAMRGACCCCGGWWGPKSGGRCWWWQPLCCVCSSSSNNNSVDEAGGVRGASAGARLCSLGRCAVGGGESVGRGAGTACDGVFMRGWPLPFTAQCDRVFCQMKGL